MSEAYVYIALMAILSGYLGVAIYSFRSTDTPAGFFAVDSNPRSIFSMTFGGVTLGTGFAFQTNSGLEFGIWALVNPIGIIFGYLMLSDLEKRISEAPEESPFSKSRSDTNFAKISEGGLNISRLNLIFNVVRAAVFIFLIAFELWLSAVYLSSILGFDGSKDGILFLAIGLGIFVSIYTAVGGLPAALRTDIFQGTSVVALIFILVGVGLWSLNDDFDTYSLVRGKSPNIEFVALIAIFITAVSTQLYNIVNYTSSRGRTARENARNFKITAYFLPINISLIVLLGILFGNSTYGNLIGFIEYTQQQDGILAISMQLLILVGFTSIIFTTVDTAIAAITQIGGSIFRLPIDSDKPAVWPRLFCSMIGVAAIPISVTFIYNGSGIVDTLLAILMPLAGLAAYLYARYFWAVEEGNHVDEPKWDYASLFFLLLITGGVNVPNEYTSFLTAPIGTVLSILPCILFFFFKWRAASSAAT